MEFIIYRNNINYMTYFLKIYNYTNMIFFIDNSSFNRVFQLSELVLVHIIRNKDNLHLSRMICNSDNQGLLYFYLK